MTNVMILNCRMVTTYKTTYLLTYLIYSMQQSPSWETNWISASRKILCILRNLKFHYRIHTWPPPVSTLGNLDPVHTSTSHLMKIYHIILPSTPRSSKWSLPLKFPQQNPVHASPPPPKRATRPAHLILLELIILVPQGEHTTYTNTRCHDPKPALPTWRWRHSVSPKLW